MGFSSFTLFQLHVWTNTKQDVKCPVCMINVATHTCKMFISNLEVYSKGVVLVSLWYFVCFEYYFINNGPFQPFYVSYWSVLFIFYFPILFTPVYSLVMVIFEHSNKSSGFIKSRELLDKCNDCQVFIVFINQFAILFSIDLCRDFQENVSSIGFHLPYHLWKLCINVMQLI